MKHLRIIVPVLMCCAVAAAALQPVAAQEAPAADAAVVPQKTLWQTTKEGGPVMIPIGLCSIAMVMLIVEQALRFTKQRFLPEALIKQVRAAIDERDLQRAYDICDRNPLYLTKLIKAGLFKDVDAAMMIHGFDRTLLHQDLLGIARATFEFSGKASHASADPWEGINALDACVQTYNAVAMLRQQVRPDCRIHGIITSGGAAANIIPEYASATFYMRAPRIDAMWELYRRVVACAEGAATASGCELKVTQHDSVYEPMKSSRVLLDLFEANMTSVGLAEGAPIPDRKGSSDVGNVSQVLPTIQPMIGIAPEGMAIHTRAFADAAVKPLARRGMVAAAKTMALTTYDLLADPARVKAAKEEFARP